MRGAHPPTVGTRGTPYLDSKKGTSFPLTRRGYSTFSLIATLLVGRKSKSTSPRLSGSSNSVTPRKNPFLEEPCLHGGVFSGDGHDDLSSTQVCRLPSRISLERVEDCAKGAPADGKACLILPEAPDLQLDPRSKAVVFQGRLDVCGAPHVRAPVPRSPAGLDGLLGVAKSHCTLPGAAITLHPAGRRDWQRSEVGPLTNAQLQREAHVQLVAIDCRQEPCRSASQASQPPVHPPCRRAPGETPARAAFGRSTGTSPTQTHPGSLRCDSDGKRRSADSATAAPSASQGIWAASPLAATPQTS
eukprot:scaffold7335_cov289-Pinguiococcus_pyrenoidosus.AAC.9